MTVTPDMAFCHPILNMLIILINTLALINSQPPLL